MASRVTSHVFTVWRPDGLLGFPEVDLAVERAEFEVSSAAVHGAVDGAIHLDAVLRLVLRVVSVAVPGGAVRRTTARRTAARRTAAAGGRLRHLHIEVGIHVTS